MNEWLFVAGPPRSGTTLMAFLLNQHPACAVLYETHFPLHLHRIVLPGVGIKNGMCMVEWHGTESAIRERWALPLLLSPGHGGRGLDLKEPEVLVRRLCEAVRSMWPPVRFFGDKSPDYCFHWSLLRELFPDCRIIEMSRDEEALVASVRRHSSGFDQMAEEAVRETLRSYRAVLSPCPGLLTVSLEALQTEPERKVREVLEWLGLSMADYPMAAALERMAEGPVN